MVEEHIEGLEIPPLKFFKDYQKSIVKTWSVKKKLHFYMGNIFGKPYRRWYCRKYKQHIWGLKRSLSEYSEFVPSTVTEITKAQFEELIKSCEKQTT